MIFWNEELQIPQKCTMCAHRLDEGDKEPRCVEACPNLAMTFGDLDDPNSDIAKLVASGKTEAFHPEHETSPLVTYIDLPKRFITGEVVRKDVPGECAQGVLLTLEEKAPSRRPAPTAMGTSSSTAWPERGLPSAHRACRLRSPGL